MRLTPKLILIAASALLSANALAQDQLGYTWLEADYTVLDVDLFDNDDSLIDDFNDGDGWSGRASFAFSDNWSIFGNFSHTDADVTFADNNHFLITRNSNIERLDVGLSFNVPIALSDTRQTDFVARAAYSDIDYGEFEFGSTAADNSLDDLRDDSSDGWFTDVALRSQLTDWLEGRAGVRYTDIEDTDNFSVFASALFEISPTLGINVEADIGNDVSTYLVGLRYTFAR